jgi:hypothetical protein
MQQNEPWRWEDLSPEAQHAYLELPASFNLMWHHLGASFWDIQMVWYDCNRARHPLVRAWLDGFHALDRCIMDTAQAAALLDQLMAPTVVCDRLERCVTERVLARTLASRLQEDVLRFTNKGGSIDVETLSAYHNHWEQPQAEQSQSGEASEPPPLPTRRHAHGRIPTTESERPHPGRVDRPRWQPHRRGV